MKNMRIMTLSHYAGYKLDPFQQEAFQLLDNNHSIIVAAPTGTGKTLVAQYAIEKVLKTSDSKKIIYTSPLKALSNQKYVDFGTSFGKDQVGLITGDLVINKNARVVIMTTEILRNMLFNDATQVRSTSYVVFDEIHYLSDPFRGSVWEQSLILLPKHIKLILLSATIANASEIAQWLSRLRKDEIHIISHSERVVPLRQYLVARGTLHENVNYTFPHSGDYWDEDEWYDEIPSIFQVSTLPSSFYPLLVFVFSRQRCADYAHQFNRLIGSLLSSQEALQVSDYLQKYLQTLEPSDRNLTNVQLLVTLLSQGIAFHHAGLLPSLKTFIEKLFIQNLIKVIFATETFALGVNYPAKSAFFPEPMKYDGQMYRYLTANEFIQMSGRAGRRGIDTEGNIIVTIDRLPLGHHERLLNSLPVPIKSQFRFNYSIVANFSTSRTINPRKFLKNSFFQYQYQKEVKIFIQKINQELESLQTHLAKLDLICTKNKNDIHPYIQAYEKHKNHLQQLDQQLRKVKMSVKKKKLIRIHMKKQYAVIGRIIHSAKHGWGIITEVYKHYNLLYIAFHDPFTIFRENIYQVQVTELIAQGLLDNISDEQFGAYHRKLQENPPLSMNYRTIVDQAYAQQIEPQKEHLRQEYQKLLENKANIPCFNCQFEEKHLNDYRKEKQYLARKQKLEEGKNTPENTLYETYQVIETILSERGYLTNERSLTRKGRILKQVLNEHELLLVELLYSEIKLDYLSISEFNGFFSSFVTSKEQLFYTDLSPVVYQIWEKTCEIREELLYNELKKGITIEGLNTYGLTLYTAVTQWSEGKNLAEITNGTKITEGMILSTLRRLINLYMQLLKISELQKDYPQYIKKFKQGLKILRKGEAVTKLPKEL